MLKQLWKYKPLRLVKNLGSFIRSDSLLIKNTVLCCVMSGTGDVVIQRIQNGPCSTRYDRQRTFYLTVTGMTVGPCCHYWYQLLDKLIPGKSIRIIFKKVVADQIIFSPICLSIFFLTLGVCERSNLKTVTEEIIEKGIILYTAEWMVWPPAQIINFYLIPLKFRVLFDNIVSFGFDIFQSRVKYPPENITNAK